MARKTRIQAKKQGTKRIQADAQTKLSKIEGKENQEKDYEVSNSSTSSNCSTPKGKRNQIPKIFSCPPAPKKQRVASNCSSLRLPISFFAPPDIELFFFPLQIV
ncbi:hypothetical protein ACHQM5_012694 [Ranunculus cassubicifolius]